MKHFPQRVVIVVVCLVLVGGGGRYVYKKLPMVMLDGSDRMMDGTLDFIWGMDGVSGSMQGVVGGVSDGKSLEVVISMEGSHEDDEFVLDQGVYRVVDDRQYVFVEDFGYRAEVLTGGSLWLHVLVQDLQRYEDTRFVLPENDGLTGRMSLDDVLRMFKYNGYRVDHSYEGGYFGGQGEFMISKHLVGSGGFIVSGSVDYALTRKPKSTDTISAPELSLGFEEVLGLFSGGATPQ